MKYYLVKTEPGTYSIDDLERDGVEPWDGVRNAQAVNFIKQMELGDRVLIYHSQGEKAIRGLAEVVSEPYEDPSDEKSWLVDLKFLNKFGKPWAELKDIKATGLFDDFRLVYQSRLSVMECPEKFIKWLRQKGLEI